MVNVGKYTYVDQQFRAVEFFGGIGKHRYLGFAWNFPNSVTALGLGG